MESRSRTVKNAAGTVLSLNSSFVSECMSLNKSVNFYEAGLPALAGETRIISMHSRALGKKRDGLLFIYYISTKYFNHACFFFGPYS